jgi:hypothetical protein
MKALRFIPLRSVALKKLVRAMGLLRERKGLEANDYAECKRIN